ncbi:MAG: sigma 54-interacting transcriptional regulator [Acidobacteriota bacterium]
MNPRLVVIDGPSKGQFFPLTPEEATVGREPSNRVALADPAASRKHCRISRQATGQFHIHDLNSRNGTFINGLPVKERILEHGDQIQVGASTFLFLTTEADETPTPSSVWLEPGRVDTRTMVRLRREQSIYLEPEKVLASPIPPARVARALNALLGMSTAIHTTRGVSALAERILALIFDVIPAERGAILLLEPGIEEPAAAFCYERASGSVQTIGVSGELVERAFHDGVGVLSGHAGAPGAGIRSVLAAPLFGRERPLGVIYLDSGDPRVCFEEDHLQLATAVGVVAGAAIENARDMESLTAENRRLQEEIKIQHDMVGESPRMAEVYRFIAKVAPSDSTVLIYGESGTGKELVARAIHRNGQRADRPFVGINCAALTETLIESELFGYEKGAFTGAIAQRKGKLEAADGGSVFLDEVGELPPAVQVKLLRVLQEREFERVGGTRSIKVDIRLITATNRDLRAAVAEGRFRADLFYRLNVVSLTMPPLRERREDIPLLANYFAQKYSKQAKRRLEGISREAQACLVHYDWPGNVRELENAIERAVVLGSADLILPEDLPEEPLETAPPASLPGDSYHASVREEKKQLIMHALERSGGNYTEAAKLLGIHPNYLHRLINNLGIKGEIKKAFAR